MVFSIEFTLFVGSRKTPFFEVVSKSPNDDDQVPHFNYVNYVCSLKYLKLIFFIYTLFHKEFHRE